MGPDAVEDGISGQTVAPPGSLDATGVIAQAQSLLHEWLGLAQDRFHLAALETRRAGESLVAMIVAGVLAGVLLGSAWLGFEAAAVLWLIEHSLVASNAVLLAVAFNLLFALILLGVMRRKSRFLQFPATLRSLQPKPAAVQPDAGKR